MPHARTLHSMPIMHSLRACVLAVYLQEVGTQLIKGRAILDRVVGPLDAAAWQEFRPMHCVAGDVLPYADTYGWEFRDAVRFETPVVSTARGQVWAIAT